MTSQKSGHVHIIHSAVMKKFNQFFRTSYSSNQLTPARMAQAVAGLDPQPGYALIDGNRCPPELAVPAQAVVKGDATSASIAAASILAKVSRDRYMLELDRQYPQYQLAKHKGYPTRLHYELIAQYGIQPFYRRSFLKKQGYWHEK